MVVPASSPRQEFTRAQLWLRAGTVMALLFIFLCGIRGMGKGFEGLGEDLLASFFQATSNPFVALVVGILGTTLMQSSSVTTSMIVAMVAAPENPLPIPNAVPMIMGANIGTTVTNTIVSLGHMTRPDEFRRAFSAATCHDFFNFMTVLVLLPLELTTGFLSSTSAAIASIVGTGGGGKLPNPIKAGTKMAMDPVEDFVEGLFASEQTGSFALIVLSMTMIFASLLALVRVLREVAGTRMTVYISRALDSSAFASIFLGLVITVMVQSSSITTSVLVPLAGAGIVTLAQVFPVTLGANIGTTVTALLASMAAPQETAALAVQIAVVHLLFNLLGVLLVYPVPAIRQLPLSAATWIADVASRSRGAALLYVIGLFYVLPAMLVFLTRNS